jgi:luciferase family oxidoreductase group 1
LNFGKLGTKRREDTTVTKLKFPLISVLETTPIHHGDTLSAALKWSVEIAKLAENLDFHRVWVAEHHATIDSGCATPAVLIAHLGSVTRRIRVGAGGVMLPNHPPLIVAEEFRMLASLYPGRVDLGIGRGAGIEEEAGPALRRERADDTAYLRQIDDLTGFLKGEFAESHRFAHVKLPRADALPSIFILGASESSAILAASLGAPLAFAHYQKPELTASAICAYRSAYDVAPHGRDPYAIASVKVVGRSTDIEARTAAVTATLIRLRKAAMSRGGLVIDEAVLLDPTMSDLERQLVNRQLALGSVIVGGPQSLRESLSNLADRLHVDEVMIVPTESEGQGRIETLRALAEARRLDPNAGAGKRRVDGT